MHLDELLQIKPGELIKGITIIETGAVSHRLLNKDGWSIRLAWGEEKVKKNPLRAILLYIEDEQYAQIKDRLYITNDPKTLTRNQLRNNTYVTKEVVPLYPQHIKVAEDEIVGMSLGETIVRVYAPDRNPYPKEHDDIMCYHKVLCREKIIWISLMSMQPIFYDKAGYLRSINIPLQLV